MHYTDIYDQVVRELYPDKAAEYADDAEKFDEWIDDLDEYSRYKINETVLLRYALPETDYIYCTEPGRTDSDDPKELFKFETMYDFDLDWWKFQKKAELDSIEDSKKYIGKSNICTPESIAESLNRFHERYAEYSPRMYGDWFRIMENGHMLYSAMMCLNSFLRDEMERFIDDLQENNIPYTWNESKHSLAALLNMNDPKEKYSAGGREVELNELLKELSRYSSDHLDNRIDDYLKTQDINGKLYRYDRGYIGIENSRSTEGWENEEKFDPFTYFIFTDIGSLKSVRLAHFLEDFNKGENPYSEVSLMVADLKKIIESDFMQIYEKNRKRHAV